MRNLLTYNAQLQRILTKLETLRNLDKGFKLFGSSNHRYELSKPISIEHLQEIENEKNIVFPDEYVAFITMLGNGGAGPSYGLYSIEQSINATGEDIDISKSCILDSKEKIEEFMERNEEIEDFDEQYDDFLGIFNGTMEINTEGCTFRNNMIVSGIHAGKIINICWDTAEDEVKFLEVDKFVGFLNWYENWLDKSISQLK